jgi:excisionase family DNA binding protein
MSTNLISTSEAALILGITLQSVGGLLRRGTIEGKKIGRDWVVSKDSVLNYKAEKEAKENQKAKVLVVQ